MNITSMLNNTVDIYEFVLEKNELNEHEKKEKYLKTCYCNIIPMNSKEVKSIADTQYNMHTHRFKFRYDSVSDIKKDWIFKFENKVFSVSSWDIDYKNREYIDVYTSLRQE